MSIPHRLWFPIHFGLACIALLSQTALSTAQYPVTQLRVVFPPGGQAGTTVSVSVVAGDDLDELSGLVFNHPGITQADSPDPLSNPRNFQIAIAADVPAGYYSVRVQGRYGVSNARLFRVDSNPSQAVTEAQIQADTPFSIDVDSAVYSRIDSATDIDEFSCQLEADTAYTISVDCLSIDSQLQPVVEVFQPDGKRIAFARQIENDDPRLTITPNTSGAYRIKIADFQFRGSAHYGYRLQVQPGRNVLSIQPPAVPANDSVEVQPLVTESSSQVPAVTTMGASLQFFESSNAKVLPGFVPAQMSFTPFETASYAAPQLSRNLAAIPAPQFVTVSEQEPNQTAEQAQQLTLPCEVHGRFLESGDVDLYEFSAEKGEQIWIQAFSQRDGQSLDLFVTLEQIVTDAAGKQTVTSIAVPDDVATNLYPNVFDTLTDDVDFLLKVPATAKFRLAVRNRYQLSAENRSDHYRLLISPPQPRFELVALNLPNVSGGLTAETPSGCVLRRGGTATLKVLANRIHGFNEPILVEPTHVPPGLVIEPLMIPPGVGSGTVVLKANLDAPIGYASIGLRGQAISADAPNAVLDTYPSKLAIPAEVVWKAEGTMPAISRVGHGLGISVVSEQVPFHNVTTDSELVQHVSQGQQLWTPLTIQRSGGFDDKLTLAITGIDAKKKVTVTAPEIAAKQDLSPVRFVFQPDAAVGWHVADMKLSSQFNYVRNPELVARTQAAYAAIETSLTAQKAKQTETTAKIKSLNETLVAQQKQLTDSAPKIAEFEQQLKANQAEQTVQTTALTAADEAAKAAIQTQLDQLTAQQKEIQKQLDALNAQRTMQTEMVKQLTAEIAASKTTETQIAAEVAKLDKQLAAQKKTLDQVNKAQAPKPLKHEAIVETITFRVHPAACKLILKSPAEITLAKESSVESTVEVTRTAGVTAPIQFSVTLPPGVTGISCEPFTLAGDQTSATIKLTAAADATVGKHAFCTIRATVMKDQHQLSVDTPLTITVPEK